MRSPAEDHPRFISDFRGALGTDNLPEGVTAITREGFAADPDALRARFAVYRNNVHHSLTQALARRFPVIERLVGAEFFAAMARTFIRDHGPRSPVLLLWGAEFAAFLRGFPPVAGLPYLPDVARLEYARGLAYHAADIQPLDGAALAAAGDPAGLRLRLSPSLFVLDCDHPAVSIWRANQPGGEAVPHGSGRQRALIFRDRDFQVPVQSLTECEAAFLRALLDGEPLETAAEYVADPTPLLTLLLSQGLIAGATAKNPETTP